MRERFDPNKHPHDPNTGEFIDHDEAFMDSLAHGTKRARREWDALSQEERRKRIEHSKRVLKALFQRYPELYRRALEMPHFLDHIALDEFDNLVDTSDPDSTYPLLNR